MKGVYQDGLEQHFLDELAFRSNNWVKLGVDDTMRMEIALRNAERSTSLIDDLRRHHQMARAFLSLEDEEIWRALVFHR